MLLTADTPLNMQNYYQASVRVLWPGCVCSAVAAMAWH